MARAVLDTLVKVRFPENAAAMLVRAAEALGSNSSSYVRQAVFAKLRADGFDPHAMPATGTTEAGVQQWALVDGDRIISISGHLPSRPEAPQEGQRWLPVSYSDSEPFDPNRHYRLAPEARVEADKVVRVYPVVAKGDA